MKMIYKIVFYIAMLLIILGILGYIIEEIPSKKQRNYQERGGKYITTDAKENYCYIKKHYALITNKNIT